MNNAARMTKSSMAVPTKATTAVASSGPVTPQDRRPSAPRQVRRPGLIERIPHTQRYRVTETGLHHAMFLARVHNRLIPTGAAQVADLDPPAPAPPRAASRAYDEAL